MIVSRWCPHCGGENLPHRRYCRECGTSLEFRCPACGFANRVGDRFCGGCGESLLGPDGQTVAPWRPAGEALVDRPPRYTVPDPLAELPGGLTSAAILAAENRLTTIVKADLSGFTAMSELLGDPEEVTVIMNQVFDPLVACVRRYGGYVDNYAGDMIICFYGTPHAVEDSAERAVRSALAMRDEVVRLNERNISHGVDLGISTGIATGFGLWGEVGVGAASKKTLSGELGDYAALIEKYADRGTVGLCPDTCQMVRHALPCEEQEGRVHRPGETEDLPVYYAGDPPPKPTWRETAEAGSVDLVGQTDLLAELTAAWSAGREGRGLALHLLGEAGVGKTRLLLELARRAEAEGQRIIAVGGRSLDEALGDDLLIELGRAAGGLKEPESALLASLEPSGAGDDVGQLVVELAEEAPLLVILDGLDWAPPALGEVVRRLADSPATLLLASRRAEAVSRWLPDVRRIEVPALNAAETAELAARFRGGDPAAGEAARLWAWSEGNPLYVREFATTPVGPRLPWRVQELSDLALDALSEPTRAVLYAAAVAADEELTCLPGLVGCLVSEPNWSRALEQALAAGLLEEAGERLRFRHRALWHNCLARLVGSVADELRARLELAKARLTAAT